MRLSKKICAIAIAIAVAILCNNSFAQDQEKESLWIGTLKDGTKLHAEDMKKIIRDNLKWLHSDGKKGKKADLREANFQEAVLWGGDFPMADLRGANLQKANLGRANLQKADLWGADLQYAVMEETNLKEAVLENANLRNAILELATDGLPIISAGES